jgi:hypothetical protein
MPLSSAIGIFIIGGLIYAFAGGEETKQLRKGLITFIITILVGSLLIFTFIKIKETIDEPTYELNGYFNKWDWETDQTSFSVDKPNFNLSIYSGQVNELPEPRELNNLIESSLSDAKIKNKGFELLKISITIGYENKFPKMIKTLYIKLDYNSSEGKSDWVWDGEKYVEKKIKGSLESTYMYDIETLQQFK